MKIGDKVRVIGMPSGLDDGDLKTKTVVERCVGKVFKVEGIKDGRIELLVGQVMGESDYLHSIWIEPALLEKAN